MKYGSPPTTVSAASSLARGSTRAALIQGNDLRRGFHRRFLDRRHNLFHDNFRRLLQPGQRFHHRNSRGFFGGKRLLRRGGFLHGGNRFQPPWVSSAGGAGGSSSWAKTGPASRNAKTNRDAEGKCEERDAEGFHFSPPGSNIKLAQKPIRVTSAGFPACRAKGNVSIS